MRFATLRCFLVLALLAAATLAARYLLQVHWLWPGVSGAILVAGAVAARGAYLLRRGAAPRGSLGIALALVLLAQFPLLAAGPYPHELEGLAERAPVPAGGEPAGAFRSELLGLSGTYGGASFRYPVDANVTNLARTLHANLVAEGWRMSPLDPVPQEEGDARWAYLSGSRGPVQLAATVYRQAEGEPVSGAAFVPTPTPEGVYIGVRLA